MTTKNKEKCSAPIRVEDQSRSRHSLVSVSYLSSILSFTIPVKQLCHGLSWSNMRSDSSRRSPPTVFHFSDLRHRPGEWKSGGDSAACVQRKVSHNWHFDNSVLKDIDFTLWFPGILTTSTTWGWWWADELWGRQGEVFFFSCKKKAKKKVRLATSQLT